MSRTHLSKSELAALPFIRPGAKDFDCEYANAIWDARNGSPEENDRRELDRLIAANPGKNVALPNGRMGFVPFKTEPGK